MAKRFFPQEEYDRRRKRVRDELIQRGMDACLITSPENIYYLCGLDHMGYFAFQMLVFPVEGEPRLVTRAVDRETVADQVPDAIHYGYPDVSAFETHRAAARHPNHDAAADEAWTGSIGVATREPEQQFKNVPAAVDMTCQALREAGLSQARIGFEPSSLYLPFGNADLIMKEMSDVVWLDASGLVDNCRLVQTPLELACTREAARLSDAMLLAAIAAAGPGVPLRDVMAAIYDAMFRRGGATPGFVPLVRSRRTMGHEHVSWEDVQLIDDDLLFLEMAGCIRRYHAPMGRLVYMNQAPAEAYDMQQVCREAFFAAVEALHPGAVAGDVYRAWHDVVAAAGLRDFWRHHCGYVVGIGFPPSWCGSGVPVGLRPGSTMTIESGMVFHLMSWLLRTGQGDAFLSDTVVVNDDGCEVLTQVSTDVTIRV